MRLVELAAIDVGETPVPVSSANVVAERVARSTSRAARDGDYRLIIIWAAIDRQALR